MLVMSAINKWPSLLEPTLFKDVDEEQAVVELAVDPKLFSLWQHAAENADRDLRDLRKREQEGLHG